MLEAQKKLQKSEVKSSESDTRATIAEEGGSYQLMRPFQEQQKATPVESVRLEPPVKWQRSSQSASDILGATLEQLDQRYAEKCRQSEAFPPQINFDIKRQSIRAFQRDISEDRLPIRACSVCAQLTSDVNSRVLSEASAFLNTIRDGSGRLVVYEKG